MLKRFQEAVAESVSLKQRVAVEQGVAVVAART